MASKKKQKPFWERAYKGHVLWLGKQKLGRVNLLDKGHYAWQAAGRARNCSSRTSSI